MLRKYIGFHPSFSRHGEAEFIRASLIRLVKNVSITAALFLSPHISHAQKVGLALSGGGAKGLYHIGVIQALEENDIPIDYVAGTSMGSIVAGLYAAGYSPGQMRSIAESGEVERWVSGKIGPEYQSLYRQMRDNAAWVTLHLNMKGRRAEFRLPPNLISSSQIDLALVGLFARADVASGGDFDRLMVPFRCVAADMAARRPVVMSAGRLGESIRASMSIPLAFKPVKKGQMLLYDGGIYDNFPWKPLDSEFAPDIIIGSICTAGNTPPDAESSIMDQAFMLVMNRTEYDMPENRSVTIRRAVPVGMLDFERAAEIIQWGYEDAMAAMDDIKARIRERRTAGEVAARRRAFREKAPELVFDHYEITGLTAAQTAYVHDFIDTHRHGDTSEEKILDFETFRHNYLCMLADGDFESEYPTVGFEPSTGRYSISAHMNVKPELSLMFGGNVSSTAFNQAFIGLNRETVGRVAQRIYAEIYLGPIYSSGALGGRTTFFLRRPMFIDYSYDFSVLNSMKGSFGNVTDADDTRKMREVENYLSIGFGLPLTHKSVLSLTVNGGVNAYRYYEGTDEVSQETSRTRFLYIAPQLKFERSTFDRKLYPRRGSQLSLSTAYVYGSDRFRRSPIYTGDVRMPVRHTVRDWAQLRFSWEAYFDIPRCTWFSFGFDIEAAVSNHPRFDNYESTVATAISYAPTTHSKMIYMPGLHADKFLGIGVMPTFDITSSMMVRASAYALFRERMTPGEERFRYIADLSMIYHTRLGPASLSLTKYDFRNWKNMYLTFNFGYALFAPKGMHN